MGDFKSLILRFPKFLAGNLVGTIVDTVVLWVFSHLVFNGYVGEVIISPIISFECAVFVDFLCSYYYIWGDRVNKRGKRSFFTHYAGYNASRTGSFLIKLLALMLIQYLTQWDVVVCNLLALCVSGGINFMMDEFVIFRKKEGKMPWR